MGRAKSGLGSDPAPLREGSGAGAGGEPLRAAGDYARGVRIPGTPFTVIQVLGRGGHATVYEIENAIGKRLVAKVIHPHLASRADFAHRFESEARTLVKLEHPNIVQVYDFGITESAPTSGRSSRSSGAGRGRPYIVMERLTGKNVREILQEVGRLEARHAIDIGIDVCSALATAHAKKVVHQDIKPDNIFIHVGLDGRPVTKLVDFGIIRLIDRPQEKGIFEGTVLYAAPEQLRFESVTVKTDLYAVGLLLFELVTGVRPFPELDEAPNAQAAVEMRLAQMARPAPQLSQWLLVSEELEAIVQQCLAVTPDMRPASASKLGDALRALKKKLASAPREPQTRTESTLLGALAEVRENAPRTASAAAPTATFDPEAAKGARGGFGRSDDAEKARVAQGVLSAAGEQSGETARIKVVRPRARGRFADVLDAGEGEQARDTSIPEAESGDEQSAGTFAPAVPTGAGEPGSAPRAPRGAKRTVAVLVTFAAVVAGGWIAVKAARGRGSPAAASTMVTASIATAIPSAIPTSTPTPTPTPTSTSTSTPSQTPTSTSTPTPTSTSTSTQTSTPPLRAPASTPRARKPPAKHSLVDFLEPDDAVPPPAPKTKPKAPSPVDGLESY